MPHCHQRLAENRRLVDLNVLLHTNLSGGVPLVTSHDAANSPFSWT